MKGRLRAFIIGTLWLAAALAMPLSGVSWAEHGQGDSGPGLGIARITYLDGDALFNNPSTEEWSPVTPNFTLIDGDRLWAGDNSKIEVKFRDGGTAWLNYESELDMSRLELGRDGNVYQVGLVTGEASFAVRNFRVLGSVFQVDTPAASIRAYGRAVFRVSASSDGSTQVGVERGSVEVETQDGVTTAGKGDLLDIAGDGYVQVADLPAKDEWDGWVDSRLKRYRQTARSARYLPSDLDDYAYELDQGGRWTTYGSYGSVWVPTSIDPGWSPYSNGRWVFMGGDYIWLGYDPWYAPFHYGRWYWGVNIGWFWIPPAVGVAYWSPGYVGWCYGASSVYWVPLGPGEIYYGYGYYGPLSVNIVNVRTVNVTNVYVNARFRNAVVAVHSDDFGRGRIRRERMHIPEKENPFVSRGRVKNVRLIGAPPVREIKPTKEMRLPKPEARPQRSALPPERVEKFAPLIRKRAPAREQGTSAFRPGAKVQKQEKNIQMRGQRPQGRIRQQEQRHEPGIQQRQQWQQEQLQERQQRQQEQLQERQQKQQERLQQQEQRRDDMMQRRQQRLEERTQQPGQAPQERVQPQERLQQREQRQQQITQPPVQKQEQRVQQPAQKKEEAVQPQEQMRQERMQQKEQRPEQRPGFRRDGVKAPPAKGVKPEKEKEKEKDKENKAKGQRPGEENPWEGEGGFRPRGQ